MKRRFKPANCLVVSLIVVLFVLMLVPFGLIGGVNMSGKELHIVVPPFGLYARKASLTARPMGPPMTIGDGYCFFRDPDNIGITVADTYILILRCFPYP